MNNILFNITNNVWINNGLAILAIQIKTHHPQIIIDYKDDSVNFEAPENIYQMIADTLHHLSAKGTYNFSTSFKIINKELRKNYSEPKPYPTSKEDVNLKKKIQTEDKAPLKKYNISDLSNHQKIWKMRVSYLSDTNNYINYGLNFVQQDEFKKLVKMDNGKKNCIFCGNSTNSEVDLKQGQNPITGEHHSNIVDGISSKSDGRQNLKVCPNCFLLSLFSLFNYYLPFFQDKKGNTILSLPTSSDINLLKKIMNNLTLDTQRINFDSLQTTSYSNNIKNISNINNSIAGCMLALLHNILNEYHEEEVTNLDFNFMDIEENEFNDLAEWIFLGNGIKTKHISANNKIYNLLKPQFSSDNKKLYLVTDALNRFPYGNASEYEIDSFLMGILKLEIDKISNGLFQFAKNSLKNPPFTINSLNIFRNIFIEKIFEEVFMLENELKEACKSLANSIGNGFHSDVGMLTKFGYASSIDEFKNALEDATFRLAKMAALEGTTKNWIDQDALSLLFNALEHHEFEELKNYFVSFMSAKVISANYKHKEK